MKYSNKRKDLFCNKHYRLYYLSKTFNDTLEMFVNIANEIGMPECKAIDEVYLFAQAKSHKNCMLATMLFGSPKKANRYVQGLSTKTLSILQSHIERFSILNKNKKFSICLKEIK